MRANGTTTTDRTNYLASFSANEDTLRWYSAVLVDTLRRNDISLTD